MAWTKRGAERELQQAREHERRITEQAQKQAREREQRAHDAIVRKLMGRNG